MSKSITRNQAKHSSLFQFVKSLFQGKQATHQCKLKSPLVIQKANCITINVNSLSPQAKQAYSQLFDSVFANVQLSKS